jgi:glycosyltransferase involved in cell wall biosynthesis
MQNGEKEESPMKSTWLRQGEQTPSPLSAPSPRSAKQRALVVSSVFTENQMAAKLGREAYSYRFVYQAFESLLRRWGQTIEITRPESRLDYALWRARRQNLEPIHLSFLPLHMTYLAHGAPNVAVPAWEFPDIPNTDFHNNPRNNWLRIADQLSVIITHCQITRNAFLRAGVKPPVHLVPVPIPGDYFQVPAWQSRQRVVLDCPCYVFPQPETPANAEAAPWPLVSNRGGLKDRARRIYRTHLKPHLPRPLHKGLLLAVQAARTIRAARAEEAVVPYPVSPKLELSGVVYSTIFNPFDPRKNFQDMLSAYLLALGDCEDATLVIKLVLCPELAAQSLKNMIHFYRGLGLCHRCKLVFVNTYLRDEVMVELARGSTYYLNTSRAEGSCLPLQNFLAAGRPGVAPAHTGMADYLDDAVGFTVASHPEPAPWPHDPEHRLTTTWQRLVWWSLHRQLRYSYEVARKDRAHYQAMAERGRERMAAYASAESVWPALAAALDTATQSRMPLAA